MKKLLLTLALTGLTASCFAQGTVVFKNYSTTPAINAPIYLDAVGGVKLSSVDGTYRAALLGGAVGTAAADITGRAAGGLSMTYYPAATTLSWVGFRAGQTSVNGAGYVNVGSSSVRAIPGVDFGANAVVQMVAWSGAYTTWADAFAAALTDSTVKVGASNPLSVVLPASSTATALTYLVGLNSFAIASVAPVPEPSLLALLGLGATSMLIFRRRK